MSQLRTQIRVRFFLLSRWLNRYWFRSTLFGVLMYALYQKDIQINFNFNSAEVPTYQSEQVKQAKETTVATTSVLRSPTSPKAPSGKTATAPLFDEVYGHTSREKVQRQRAYIRTYSDLAVNERHRFGIPASITLAQGLLESNAGKSKLATQNRNHFGIKCFSKTCKKGHCSNFSDDSHKDFFRIYKNAEESFRAHSKLLSSPRYQHLLDLETNDYRAWAHGLHKAGYATDKQYAQKLIHLIEKLSLYEFDEYE